MPRPRLFLLLFAACLLLPGGQARAEQLRFGYDEYPPLSYTVDGEAAGHSIELVREASRRIGVEPVFVSQPFIRLLSSVREGTVDSMVDLYETPERKEFVYFASESATSEFIILYVRRDARIRITSLEDARRYKVGAVRGYYYGKLVDAELRDQLALVKDCKILYGMLSEGRFDAVVGNSLAAGYYIADSLDRGDILPVLELDRLDYHVVFSRQLGPRGQALAERYAEEIARILRAREGAGTAR